MQFPKYWKILYIEGFIVTVKCVLCQLLWLNFSAFDVAFFFVSFCFKKCLGHTLLTLWCCPACAASINSSRSLQLI